ncbi:glycoside hydrolase family 95 protein [Cohnella lupini]|uniref:Alpha-L-fucosidase 2 n=1 Tax=Cohnella lupini TaxID=1294267 RepID=A0A3D9IJJ3_9BACL|nr:glycoside hydrolase family 95 protein [Cohnella lupini]RED61827.1 alpha-L-fucosidase 2 [Cohnella lupini]
MKNWKLWYSSPAVNWQQGLPLGNGRLGAVVYGGIANETWRMTELTYWSGQAERTPSASKGRADLDRIRQPFFAGNYKQGEELASQLFQPEKGNFGTNLHICDILLQFEHQGEDFVRELDLDHALVRKTYNVNGMAVSREVLATHVDSVVASRLWSEHKGGISFSLGISGSTPSFASSLTNMGTIAFEGKATETIHSDGECGVFCKGVVKVFASGGAINYESNKIVVENADEAFIYFAVNTDYEQDNEQWDKEAERQIDQAAAKGFSKLKEAHIADYRRLFGRVDIDLGHSSRAELPIDERKRLFLIEPDADPQLFALFFQYGRYLMIAGSRADSPLPMHLQGIWNDGEANLMEWSCDYHLDINTEMNYYPAEVSNLSESQLPLIDFIDRLSIAGQSTAQDFYGCKGWVAHVFTNAWLFTAPGWQYTWGLHVTGGLWLATQLREHYEFGRDRNFLEDKAYPILKGAAAFFLDYMIQHPKYGWLVTGPSNSPENSFYADGYKESAHHLSMGATLDQVLVRDLFSFCLKSAGLLQVDFELQDKLKHALTLLPPLRIGTNGQLQEWLEDYEEAVPDHRHLSHLYSLYPSNQITPAGSAELSAAARRTLENRRSREDLEDVEFTAAAFSVNFARLHDGERAYGHLSHLIGQLSFDNLLTYSKPGIAGAENNIFVVDGNFGGMAAMAEMLLQSHAGEIHLLPALPKKWPTGKVSGLRAKGNLEVDISWENGILVEARIQTFSKDQTLLRYANQALLFEGEPNCLYVFDNQLSRTELRRGIYK